MSAARQPRRLVSRPEHPLCAMLQDAARLEPPEDARARVLWRLVQSLPRRLVEKPAPDDPVARLLAGVASPDPSAIQRARILRDLGPVASRRRRMPGWGAVGLTTAIAAVVLAFLPSEEPSPPATPVEDSAPTASVGDASGSRRQILAGLGEVMLSSDARLEIERDDASGARLSLASGRLALHASSRQGRGPLVIAARGVEVAVVGTVFAIDASGPAATVTVAEGLVEIRHGGRETTKVGAGQRWSGANEAVTAEASGWAAWAMRQVGGGQTLILENIRDVSRRPEPSSRTVRSRRSRTTESPPQQPAETDFDLDRLARQHASMPAFELSRRIAEARTSFDRRAEAVWLRALADAPDATALQLRTSLLELAKLLDDDLARPLDAIEVRRTLAKRFATLRGEASFQIMLAASELGASDATGAIEACLEICEDPALSFARFLFARQLQLDGQLTQAQAAMDHARREATGPGGAERLAELFFLRARHFLHRGQVERAQGAASLCRAFDGEGLHTAQLRHEGL